MHMVIRAIVYAKAKGEALDKAREIFERLCENQHPFDYFVTFDGNGSPVSGKGRWGNFPAVTKARTNRGKKLIEDGMKFTKDEFISHIKTIRFIVEHFTDEEIFADKPIADELMKERAKKEGVHLFDLRYPFGKIGDYRGPSVWLYDNDGEGIREDEHLKAALEKWPEHADGKYDGLDVWVVPADVHY